MHILHPIQPFAQKHGTLPTTVLCMAQPLCVNAMVSWIVNIRAHSVLSHITVLRVRIYEKFGPGLKKVMWEKLLWIRSDPLYTYTHAHTRSRAHVRNGLMMRPYGQGADRRPCLCGVSGFYGYLKLEFDLMKDTCVIVWRPCNISKYLKP